MTAVTTLDEAIDELYAGPVTGFVAERNRLAAELRAAGDRDTAAAVKALRKPTVAADALNKALRADERALDGLLASLDDLRRAQRGTASGESDRADLVEAQARYREAVAAVAAAASTQELAVAAAIDAAAVAGRDDELRQAAFVNPPERSGGFGIEAPPDSPPAPRRSPSGRRPAGRGSAGRSPAGRRSADGGGGQRRLRVVPSPDGAAVSSADDDRAEAARRAAEEAVRAATAELEAATGARADAAERVAALDVSITELEARLLGARRERDDAATALTRAEARMAEAARTVDDARRTVDDRESDDDGR